MKNRILVTAVVVVGLMATAGGVYALRDKVFFSSSPEQTVLDFYETWAEYDGNPMVDRIYHDNEAVTSEFKTEMDGIIDSFDKGGYDPVFCAQDMPGSVEVTNISINGDEAVVTLKEDFGGSVKMIEVVAAKDGFREWKIDRIICQEGQSGADNDISPAIKESVGEYIKDNIAELSPEDPVLGGNFFVTSINFIGPNECVVDYEDGHIVLRAKAEFRVPSAGEVEIVEFEIMEDEQSDGSDIEFSRTGNLVERDDQWVLVYEEPGKPAVTARLQFIDQSACFSDAGEEIACIPASWEEGVRVEVSGTETGDLVKVDRLAKKK